jgi:hypothetical protein
MKKRWTEARWRERNRLRAEDSLSRRNQWKEWKRSVRQDGGALAEASVESRVQHRTPKHFLAPTVLSLITAPDDSASFFRDLQGHIKHRNVFVDLSNVEVITPDAIALLLAVVKILGDKRRLLVSGNYPDEPMATETILESGFTEYLRTSMPPGPRRGAIVRQDLYESSTLADGDYARRLIDFAAKNSSDRLRLKIAYGHLLECMGNTHQHAGRRPGEKTWWASVFRDGRRQCDCFTFVDMGIGIFNSVELSMRLKLLSFTGWGRPKVLKELLEGNIPSSTGKAYRGRGLPSIFRSCAEGKFHRLVILTNDVYADAERNDFRSLRHDIKGVVLYWEVNHERS